MLMLHDLPAWPFWAGGAAIAAITLALLAITNRRLGISSGFEDVCSLVVHSPYFRREEVMGGRKWRLPFLLGLLLGGVLSASLGGGFEPTWELGMFDRIIGGGPAVKVAWMFAGGLCIGFGTRLGGGCTSGHGIFGMSNFEKASIVATLSFMAAGVVTTNLIYRVIFAAGG